MTNPFNAKPSDILMAAAFVVVTLNAACSVIRVVNPELLSSNTVEPVQVASARD